MDRFALGHIAWPILVAHARERTTLTYKQLAKVIGYDTARVSRAALWSIQDFCIEKGLPPLTSIVVNQRTGVPGQGFKLGSSNLEDAQGRAFAFNWTTVPTPFPERSLARLRRRKGKSAVPAIPQSFEVPDAEASINGRGPYQDRFRKLLLRVYGRRCALCDTRFPKLLVASHIVPWAQDSKNRLNPQNGILLCSTHDAAFEHGLLRVQPNGVVELAGLDAAALGGDLHLYLKRTKMRLPAVAPRFRPRPEFLEWKLARVKA